MLTQKLDFRQLKEIDKKMYLMDFFMAMAPLRFFAAFYACGRWRAR